MIPFDPTSANLDVEPRLNYREYGVWSSSRSLGLLRLIAVKSISLRNEVPWYAKPSAL